MIKNFESIKKAKDLLRQLFRSTNADLDFGIYRIMNFKRAEIERFIDNDLIKTAENEFKELTSAEVGSIEKELKKLKNEINDVLPGTIDENYNIIETHDSPKISLFRKKLEDYNSASVSEENIQDVFNHVFEFFSRWNI